MEIIKTITLILYMGGDVAEHTAFEQIAKEASEWAALAIISVKNKDLETTQQHHQKLFSSCKSCHSRFKN